MDKVVMEAGFEWKDLTSEKYRTYVFSKTKKTTIQNPERLAVSASGGHRVVDKEGVSHYIPSGWIELLWEVYPDKPKFSF